MTGILTKNNVYYKFFLKYHNFLFVTQSFWEGRRHCPISEKNHLYEQNFCLEAYIFTKLSQNLCLINTHILTYWHARCGCKSWNAFWFYCVFRVFSYINDNYSCLKYCIFTKLSQIVCLINIHILVCQHAKCACRLWKVFYLICVF